MKKKLACDSIESLPDGGRIYHYLIDGVLNSFPVPPDGFDPIHASDQELETYAFPPRPNSNSDLYESWLNLVGNYTGTPIPEIEVYYAETEIPNNETGCSPTSIAKVSTVYDTGWSGYASKLTDASTFYTQAQVNYIQPLSSLRKPDTGDPSLVVCWTGIGSFLDQTGRGALVQAGTTCESSLGNLNKCFAWYEYLNNSNRLPYVKVNLVVRPGDSIHVYISYQAANGKFNYYIANNTTGESTSAVVAVESKYFDGSSVEWIVEKPAKSYFGKFSDLTLSNCQATKNTSNNWIDMGNLSGLYKVIMTETGLATAPVICTPGEIKNNTDFGLTWSGYGKPTGMDES